ncbi:unnamed protein product [Caenorhabditis brenneri]
MRYSIKRDKLLEKKPFKNSEVTIKSFLSIIFPAIFYTSMVISIPLSIDLIRNGGEREPSQVNTGRILLFVSSYIIFIGCMSMYAIYKFPQKYFKLCSLLAIFSIFPILFVVFYLFQTHEPGPDTDKLLEFFKVSYYVAFIWLPVLIISFFTNAFVLWIASGIESYTVIMDGKGSSTKLVDGSYDSIFVTILLSIVFTSVVAMIAFLTDGCRNNFKFVQKESKNVLDILIFAMYYPLIIVVVSLLLMYIIPEKFFKLCSLMAILQISLILFIVFHPLHTFLPGPKTDKLVAEFTFSFYAAFIWIPLLIILLLLLSFVVWIASGIESYTVIMDEKGSSTKLVDGSYDV